MAVVLRSSVRCVSCLTRLVHRAPLTIQCCSSRPLPVRVPSRSYYYVPKKKKGPGLKGWLVAGGVLVGMTGFGIAVLGRPQTEEEHQAFAMPSSTVLLPDPLPVPYQPPYTLVLEMSDVMVHAEYELKSGWRYRKRPGLTAFLRELTPYYEIIIFTTEAGFNAQPVVAAIDPRGEAIFYTLFRDSTTYLKGKHIKDLNNLNRNLKHVIAIDVDPASCERNEQNVLVLKRWQGDTTDRVLIDLIPFLKTIAVSGVDDVRPVIDFYRKQDDPIMTFKQNQARLAQQTEEQQRRAQESKSNPAGGSNWSSSGLFGKFFGRGSNKSQPNSQSAPEAAESGSSAAPSAEQQLQSMQPSSDYPVKNEQKSERSVSHDGITQQGHEQTPPPGEKSLFGRWFG